jgi:hypothetical protein
MIRNATIYGPQVVSVPFAGSLNDRPHKFDAHFPHWQRATY